MSLLKGSKDNLNFTYQLPLNIDDQLAVLDKFLEFTGYGLELSYSKTWSYIKEQIVITEALGDNKEKSIWNKGILINEVPDMLGHCYKASEFFLEKFRAFIGERGIV